MKRRKTRTLPFKQIIFLVLFAVILVSLVATTIGRKEFSGPHKFLFEVLGTAQDGLTGVVRSTRNLWSDYIALWDLRDENDRLKEELQKFQVINIKYREAVATNLRLSKMLDLKEALPPPTLTGLIMGRDPSLWFKTFTVNRGSREGVSKGMPVVTVEGVVGHVLESTTDYAKVLQANDPNSAIEVLVQDTRVQGIVKGTGSGYQLHYVLKNNKIRVGDLLVTSGLGGVFPKGLPVGTVSKVVNNRRGMFLEVEVTPAVDFSRLEHVIIILKSNQLAG